MAIFVPKGSKPKKKKFKAPPLTEMKSDLEQLKSMKRKPAKKKTK